MGLIFVLLLILGLILVVRVWVMVFVVCLVFVGMVVFCVCFIMFGVIVVLLFKFILLSVGFLFVWVILFLIFLFLWIFDVCKFVFFFLIFVYFVWFMYLGFFSCVCLGFVVCSLSLWGCGWLYCCFLCCMVVMGVCDFWFYFWVFGICVSFLERSILLVMV